MVSTGFQNYYKMTSNMIVSMFNMYYTYFSAGNNINPNNTKYDMIMSNSLNGYTPDQKYNGSHVCMYNPCISFNATNNTVAIYCLKWNYGTNGYQEINSPFLGASDQFFLVKDGEIVERPEFKSPAFTLGNLVYNGTVNKFPYTYLPSIVS